MNIEKLKYPIGTFSMPQRAVDHLDQWINGIGDFPATIENAVDGLSTESLSRRYRPGGWTIKQVVHHCADSHMNALIRFKLALTEPQPVIKPYAENLWAELKDSLSDDLRHPISILKGVHAKWAMVMKSMGASDWQRAYFHPEKDRLVSLMEGAGMYEWHCRHHHAHIQLALAGGY